MQEGPLNEQDITLFTVVVTVAYLTAFALVNKGLRPKTLKDHRKAQTFDNASVSFVHSLISSVLVLLCFVLEWDNLMDLYSARSLLCQLTLAHSVGYFTYDLISFWWYKREFSMFVHHVIFIVCYSLVCLLRLYNSILVIALVAEINSLFLHLRKMMQMAQIPDLKTNWIYKIALWGLSTTYVPFRLGPHLWILYKITLCDHEFQFLWQYALALSGTVVINLLNFSFLYKFLFTDAFFGPKTTREKQN